MILHVDANSFYASCERIFRPDLFETPIAVLSNNDGIIVALDQHCKNLGLKRGDPYFKVKDLCNRLGIQVFSSNYTLYADISRRLNIIYSMYCQTLEIYSIDESFLFVPDARNLDYTQLGTQIKQTVWQQVHIPVSVGIAPTKTLAKMCNKLAKKNGGIFDWTVLTEKQKESTLKQYPAKDIWGIGPAKAYTLLQHGIRTSWDLKKLPYADAQKLITVNGLRTVLELNGSRAIDQIERQHHDNITQSRSFSGTVTKFEDLEKTLYDFTQEAVRRLREENSACTVVGVMIMTAHNFCNSDGHKAPPADNRGVRKYPGCDYSNYGFLHLPEPSKNLVEIFTCARKILAQIYRSGFSYKKVMINLMGLQNAAGIQGELFQTKSVQQKIRDEKLMQAFDKINTKYGKTTLTLGQHTHLLYKNSTQHGTTDDPKNNPLNLASCHKSANYTTCLEELPEVI